MSLDPRKLALAAGAAALIGAAFAADSLSARHLAVWILYLPACALAALNGRAVRAFAVAAGCTALVLAGAALASTETPAAWEWINRAAGILMIWVTAAVSLSFARRAARHADALAALVAASAERSNAIALQNRSERRLAAVINTATDAIITVDQEQNIVMINPAAERLFGYLPGELMGKPLVTLLPARFRAMHPQHVTQFGGTGKTARRMGGKVDVFGMRADGEEFPVDASISSFAEDGRMFFTVILRDITAKKQAEAALTESQRELRELSDNLVTVREEERKRVARELHDDLGQRLAALRNDFTMLRKGLEQEPRDEARLTRNAGLIDALLIDTIAALRRISADLRPRPLDDLGLVAAVKVLLNDFSRQHDLHCELNAEDVDPHVDDRIAVALYRMVQESLNNAAKHARAGRVMVRMFHDGADLVVEIADDGVGIAPPEMRKRGSFGLIGMRERAAALGGKLSVDSAPGSGTRLRLAIPVGGT